MPKRIPEKCAYCGSKELKIVKNGPHEELICSKCFKYQCFLTNKEARLVHQLKGW